MINEAEAKRQLKLKMETYKKQDNPIARAILEGWINALRYFLELPQQW